MNYLGVSGISRFIVGIKGFYSGINGATLTGAIDVIVVEQEDGTFKCSPFHVRFGKLGVLRSREKVVDIEVNGVTVPIRMKLGDSGEAFFVEEVYGDDELNDEYLATSPLPMSPRHSDNDSLSSRLKGRRDTDESVDLALINPESTSIKIMSLDGSDDPKNRKRRKKRRKNPGSKTDGSDSKTNLLPEEMFSMDEDLARVSEALSKLEMPSTSGLLMNGGSMVHSRSFHRDFYSDTEIDVTCTPHNSRPSTPIQSDSEYEIAKHSKEPDDDNVGKWPWGELPSPAGGGAVVPNLIPPPQPPQIISSPSSPQKSTSSDETPLLSSDDESSRTRAGSENKSMLSGMFSFMKRNSRHVSGGSGTSTQLPPTAEPIGGMYLDDINPDNMDPDQFALYFPNVVREKDYFIRRERDEDVESGKGSSLPQSPQPGSSPKSSNISVYMEERQQGFPHHLEAISLCGNNLALFEQSRLTFDELVENPDIVLKSPESIVVKMDGKYVSWAAALPTLLSTTFFKRPLPESVYQRLLEQYGKKDESQNENLGKDVSSKKQSSWFFSWRRSNSANATVTSSDEQSSSILPTTSEDKPIISTAIQVETNRTVETGNRNTLTSSSDESEGGGGMVDNKSGRSSRRDMHTAINIPQSGIPIPGAVEKYKKTMRMNTEQITALGLKPGQNEAVFSVTTAYQGTTSARCHIYLWRYDDRVVISDIDGTITKSDVLGHVLPMIGNDWAQSGVAQLFTQIQDNGYKLLYLSARSIGQASATRDYLRSIKQDDVTLPDGPLLLNPTSLMSAFHREVIERRPEEFKISCLKDVQLLFPRNPFYAGYGNRINDVWAYRAVDIAVPRIFTINHRGELRHALTNTFQSSYTNLIELVEHIFPVYKDRGQADCDGFNGFEFWRDPIPELPILNVKLPILMEVDASSSSTMGNTSGEAKLLNPRSRRSF